MGACKWLTFILETLPTIQGNIGSTDAGMGFLNEELIVEAIVDIAEQSPVLSIRGYVIT